MTYTRKIRRKMKESDSAVSLDNYVATKQQLSESITKTLAKKIQEAVDAEIVISAGIIPPGRNKRKIVKPSVKVGKVLSERLNAI